jgi:hypothetical protein
MRIVRMAPWVGIALLAVACGDRGDFEERVRVEPGGLLEVTLDLGVGMRPDQGSLEVGTHEANEVRVVADASGWGASGVAFELEHDERGVRFYGRVVGALSWMFGGPRVEVRIWVPREFSLDLRSSAGPIRIDDTTGSVRARTSDAEIEVEGVEGDLKLRTRPGSIRVAEVTGSVDIRASSGDLELSWIRGDVEARTGRGEIHLAHVDGEVVLRSDRGGIEVEDLDGSVEAKTERGNIVASFVSEPAGSLETSRGSVELEIPAGAGAQLEAVSRRGAVELAQALTPPGEHSESRVAGPINGGGQPLRLYTARGGVRVRPR